MKRYLLATVAALVFAALAGAAADAADRRVVVFDFVVERSREYEWVGSALSEYAVSLLDSAPGFEAVDRESVVRLLRRYGYGFNKESPFEVKDRIRGNLGGDIVIEGICSGMGGELRFKGSIVEFGEGGIVSDLEFKVSPFDIFTAQKRLREALEKAVGTKIENNRKRLLGTDSTDAYLNYRKGKSLFEMGVYEQAVGQLKQAVKKDGRYAAPYIALGQTMLESANFKEAKENLEKAIALSPSNFRAHLLLGMVSYVMYDRGAAERHFMKAISVREREPDAHYRLAALYYADRRYPDAEREYMSAVELDPEMPEGWYGLAVLYSINRNEKKTMDAAGKAVRTGGDAMRERMRNDRDFDWLKTKKEFIWLVGKGK